MEKQQRINQLLYHVFLPSRINFCCETQSSKQSIFVESENFASLVIPLFQKVLEQTVPVTKGIPQTCKLFQNSLPLYESSSFGEKVLLKLFKTREDFLLHWKDQNSTILVKFLQGPGNSIKIYLFPQANIPEESIYKGNNIQVQLPLNCYLISLDKVKEELLVSQMVSLQFKKDTFQQNIKRSAGIDKLQNVVGDENIRNWFIPSLNPEPTDFTQITKKIKDESLKEGIAVWRRSSIYLSIKHVLHHQVIEERGSTFGYSMYKLVILQFQMHLLSEIDIEELESGIFNDIIVKIENRIEKLRLYLSTHDISLLNVEEVMLSMETKLDDLFNAKKKLHFDSKDDRSLPTTIPLDNTPISQQFTTFRKHLNELLRPNFNMIASKTKPSRLPNLPTEGDYGSIETLLLQLQQGSPKQILYYKAWMVAVERAVNIWWLANNTTHSIAHLFKLFHCYKEKSESIYIDDLVGMSLKYLTLATICALIDKLILRKYPLFTKHAIDFTLPTLDSILLPELTFMHQLHSIELYYQQRSGSHLLPGILSVSENSAATVYAMGNETICKERYRILQVDKNLQQEKRKELKKKKKKKKELESKIAMYGP